MQPYSENYNLSKKRWRAINYDWDTLSLYFNNYSRLYCLTDFQVAWLQANVPYMSWQTRWNNCPCTPSELSDFASELEYALMTCINIQPYQLEFNYNQAVESVLDAYNDAYGLGGIPELNPNTPTDFYSGDGSQERLDALCTATNIYVRSYVTNWVATAQAVLNVTVVIAIALSLTGVGGVIAGTVLAGLAFVTQTALDAMQDNDAIDDVVCCMYNELIGAVINNALFVTSLDNCNFTVGSNQAIIRDIIASDLPQFSNWLSFLNSVGDSFVLAQNGIIDCPCNASKTVIVTFDTLINIDYIVTESSPSLVTIQQSAYLQDTAQGNPTPSARMAFGTFLSGDEGFSTIVRVDLGADFDVTNVGFEYYFFRIGASNIVLRSIQLLDSSNNVVSQLSSSANDGIQNAWTVWGGSLSGNSIRYIECAMALSLTPPVPTPSNTMAWIDNVTFTKAI